MYHRSTSLSTQGVWLCVALTLVIQLAASSPAQSSTSSSSNSPHNHRVYKRSYFELECKGAYDKSIFARLDRICVDCYNLYREPQVYSLCRSKCFSSTYFKGCVEALQMKKEWDSLTNQIEQLLGRKAEWKDNRLFRFPKGPF